MKSFEMQSTLRLTVLASALMSAFGGASAQEADEVTRLSRPESTIEFGLGYVDDTNRRFGQYRGLTESGFIGTLNVDISQRDDATGTILRARGRNLGLDSRDFRIEHTRQGQWGYFFDYTEMPRHQQYVINTGLRGIGTDSLTVAANSPANRRDVSLKVKREKATFGYSRNLGGGFDAQVRFSNEEKDGARLFAQGTSPFSSSGAFYFLAEPLNSTTQMLDASIGYTGDALQLQGGYSASMFDNHLNGLRVANGTGLQPMALPPGNEAHQVFLAGAYEFSRTTRGNFKVAYGKATQNDRFITLPVGQSSLSSRTDLGGEVDTTLVNASVSSRPLPKLSVSANFRYEDRDDQTPIVTYNSTTPYDNRSFRVTSGKVDAGYQIASGLRGIAAVEHEIKERAIVPNRVANQREETEETTVRLELRRSLSETLNGGLAVIRSDRDGSDYYYNGNGAVGVGSGYVAPLHIADRKRDKVRLSADWAATEAFSLQVMAEQAQDEYSSVSKQGPLTPVLKGLREGRGELFSLDATYVISDDWQLSAFAQHSESEVDQNGGTGAATAVFFAGFADRSDTTGVSLKGKLARKIDVGAELQHARNVSKYAQVNGSGANIALPNVQYETTTLRLYGRYPLQVNAGVQVDLVHDRRVNNDWTWTSANRSALFDDGTTVKQAAVEKANFIGVSGYYKWW